MNNPVITKVCSENCTSIENVLSGFRLKVKPLILWDLVKLEQKYTIWRLEIESLPPSNPIVDEKKSNQQIFR